MMKTTTPVIFTDGTELFNKISKTYTKHEVGYFILAPSATGKTYFINLQNVKHWIDGDYLWPLANADVTDDEWNYDFSIVMETNNRCDVITEQAKKQGLWVIGSSNNWLKPDAIVLPHWSTHKKYVALRENTKYDGGAKKSDLNGLIEHRKWIAHWKKQNVPHFKSILEATEYLSKLAN